jgi:hypothetical protein
MNKDHLLTGYSMQTKSGVLGQTGNQTLQFIIYVTFDLWTLDLTITVLWVTIKYRLVDISFHCVRYDPAPSLCKGMIRLRQCVWCDPDLGKISPKRRYLFTKLQCVTCRHRLAAHISATVLTGKEREACLLRQNGSFMSSTGCSTIYHTRQLFNNSKTNKDIAQQLAALQTHSYSFLTYERTAVQISLQYLHWFGNY